MRLTGEEVERIVNSLASGAERAHHAGQDFLAITLVAAAASITDAWEMQLEEAPDVD